MPRKTLWKKAVFITSRGNSCFVNIQHVSQLFFFFLFLNIDRWIFAGIPNNRSHSYDRVVMENHQRNIPFRGKLNLIYIDNLLTTTRFTSWMLHQMLHVTYQLHRECFKKHKTKVILKNNIFLELNFETKIRILTITFLPLELLFLAIKFYL